jgi:hypothetical protein
MKLNHKIAAEADRFESVDDFRRSMTCGGEAVFSWGGTQYGVFRGGDGRYCIARADGENEKRCDTPDEVLEYTVAGERLRDVITQVAVVERTL